MTPAEILSPELADVADSLRSRQEPFAFATIIRTAGTTAAKPGAKAIIDAEGTILQGFLGGGCTRGAVRRAVLQALETGAPQLVSVAPEEDLTERGLAPGDATDGVTYAKNGCPSRGTVDIFIEPCLPQPELIVIGNSPVAQALAALAPQFQWTVAPTVTRSSGASRLRAVVVATQGQGDLDALTSAYGAEADYVAFVGSKKKFEALSETLRARSIDPNALEQTSAPAGLDIGAVTAEEITLSILAELTQVRRRPLT